VISYNISGYPHTYTKKLNFKKGDYNSLRKDLHIDWDMVLCDNSNDIEKLWKNFKDIIHQAIMNNIPTVCNFASWKKSKWKRPLHKNTLALIKEKRRLWKLYIYTKQAHIFRDYRKITNKLRKCTTDINRAKQCEIAFTVKDNAKKIWNFVNSKRKNKERIGDLEYVTAAGVKDIANTDEVKADILNTFFSVFSHESNCNFSSLPVKQISQGMPPVVFDRDNILERLEKLKLTKSPGPDMLHPRLLYEARQEIAYAISSYI